MQIIRMLVCIIFLVSLVSCGGSSGSSSGSDNPPVNDVADDGDGGGAGTPNGDNGTPNNDNNTPPGGDVGTETVAGVVVDPYISGAVFCLDANKNGTCDEGETLSGESDENGAFEFENGLTEGDHVAMYTAGTHNGVPYAYGRLRGVYENGSLVVSPITTLYAKGLTAEELAELFSAAGLQNVQAENVAINPMSGLFSGDTVDEEKLAVLRSSLASYTFLRIVEGSAALSALTPDEIYASGTTGGEVYTILSGMAGILNTSLSTQTLTGIRNDMAALPQGFPSVTFDDVVAVSVAIADRLSTIAYEKCNETDGDVAEAIGAVESYITSASVETMISNLGPAFYLARVKGELTEAMQAGVGNAGYGNYLECPTGSFDTDDHGNALCAERYVTGDNQKFIAQSPVIKSDVDPKIASERISARAGLTQADLIADISSYSISGGCITMAMRANARQLIPEVEQFRCVAATAAKDGLISQLDETGRAYADFYISLDERVLHYKSMIQAVEGENGTYSGRVSSCRHFENGDGNYYDDNGTQVDPEENVRVYFERDENNKYKVQGTMIRNNYYHYSGGETESGMTENGYRVYAAADETDPARDIYTYIQHAMNVSTNNSVTCQGASGGSLTEDDDLCFLRYEGSIVNEYSESGDRSYFSGFSAEKLPRALDDQFFVLGGSSVIAALVDGLAVSYFDNGGGIQEDVWSSSSMKYAEKREDSPVGFQDNLPERTAFIPDIEDKWNCMPDGAEFVSIDINSLSNHGECFPDLNITGSGDLTTCGETSDNDPDKDWKMYQIHSYLCDESDPLTSSEGIDCTDNAQPGSI